MSVTGGNGDALCAGLLTPHIERPKVSRNRRRPPGQVVGGVGRPAPSAPSTSATGEVILKVVNVMPKAQTAKIKLQGAGEIDGPARLIVLASANAADENSLECPTKVVPKTQTLAIPGLSFSHTFPANSVSVLRVKTKP